MRVNEFSINLTGTNSKFSWIINANNPIDVNIAFIISNNYEVWCMRVTLFCIVV